MILHNYYLKWQQSIWIEIDIDCCAVHTCHFNNKCCYWRWNFPSLALFIPSSMFDFYRKFNAYKCSVVLFNLTQIQSNDSLPPQDDGECLQRQHSNTSTRFHWHVFMLLNVPPFTSISNFLCRLQIVFGHRPLSSFLCAPGVEVWIKIWWCIPTIMFNDERTLLIDMNSWLPFEIDESCGKC